MNESADIPEFEPETGFETEMEPRSTKSAPAKRDPVSTLNLAILVYIAVNALFGIPLTLAPAGFYDFVGVASEATVEFDGLRWLGAMLLAWAVSAILVLARPTGRAFFVTAGSLQLTFGAVAFVYSWSLGEGLGATWFQVVGSVVLIGAALVLWWARLTARKVLSAPA